MTENLNERGFTLLEALVVVGIIGVLAAIALPMTGSAVRYAKISGDARDISNDLAVAKMRAAAKFTQARLYADLTSNTYYIQTCDTPATTPCPGWTTDGGTNYLSSTVSFGYGTLGSAPSYTQTTIGQGDGGASPCLNNAGTAVSNTACIIFNSRGIPVTTGGTPTGGYALYINDGSFVYGITIAATGFIRTWRSGYYTVAWSQQ